MSYAKDERRVADALQPVWMEFNVDLAWRRG